MTGRSKRIFFSLCWFSVSLLGKDVECETPSPIRVVARHIEANGIGYNQGYTTLEGFVSPLTPIKDVWVPFLDLRSHIFNNGQPAANAGVGIRYLASSRVWGGNAYYDYRKTHRQHYNQVAVGLESLGEVWDYRINGYLPVGKTKSGFWGYNFDHFQNNAAILSRKREFALKGVDAEAAAHIPIAKNVDFTAAAGPYYLTSSAGTAWGGRARVGFDLFKYCRVEGFTSYDKIFRWTGQGQLSIVIPLGRKREIQQRGSQSYSTAVTLASRSVQPVYRFEIIPVDRKKTTTPAINPLTGQPYFFLFVSNTSSSLGTFESPYATLTAAQNASVAGDAIYVFPGDGTSTGLNAGITLKDNQFLFGAGTTNTLPTTVGTIPIPSQASGFPNLTASAGSSVITVANNNIISGFTITSDAGGTVNGSYCIGSLSGTTENLSVSQNILSANNGALGIIPNEPSGQITITNNTIQSDDTQGTYGIYLAPTSGNSSYSIQNNLISNFQNHSISPPSVPSGTGIAILAQDQSNVNAIISQNQILYCRERAIDVRSFTGTPSLTASITSNQIQGLSISGVGTFLLSDDTSQASFLVLNNRISAYTFGLIAQAETNSSMTAEIQHNSLSSGPFGSGIVLETNFLTTDGAATAAFDVSLNDVSHYGDAQGIATAAYGSSSLQASIKKNSIHEIGKAGLYLRGFNSSTTNLVITDNTIIDNNEGMEIDFRDDSAITIQLQGNSITYNNGAGFFAHPSVNSNAKFQILSNTFTNNNSLDLNSGSAVTIVPQNAANVCLRMESNQSSDEATQPDYYFNTTSSGQFNVEPLTGNIGTIEQTGTTSVPSGFCE